MFGEISVSATITDVAQWLRRAAEFLLCLHVARVLSLSVVGIHRVQVSPLYLLTFQTAPLIEEPSQEELDLPPPRRQFLEDSEDQSRRSYR